LRRLLLVIGLSVLAAGCGGGSHTAATSTQAGPTVPSITIPTHPVRGCSFVSLKRVEQLTGASGLKRIDLAPGTSGGVRCSTVFAGAGGSNVVTISELDGGPKALAQLRARKASGSLHVPTPPARGFPAGAFSVRGMFLAVPQGGRILTFETGYDSAGRPILSRAQLDRLAHALLGS
jgi:hypothetical protein